MFCTPENLLIEISGALGMKESHFLSKICFGKCCGVSQKWWMLELSNLCHCVQHPWKLTSKDYWSSRNERKPLSQLNHVLRKCSGVSQKQWMPELSKPLPSCSAPLENLLVGISGALGTKENCFLSKNVFWEMLWGISETVSARVFNHCHCVLHPWNLLVGISGALGTKESHFLG